MVWDVPKLLRMLSRGVPALAAAVCLQAAAQQAAVPPGAGVARGLIVQLKDASAHPRTAAAATEGGASARLPAAVPERLQRLLDDAGFVARRSRPVGRAAHLVDFGRPLGPAEAAAMAAKLRARPDVAWVVPNERERLLATPTDPMFPASVSSPGQWWMFPNGGTSANALDARLRGVPGLQTAWNAEQGKPGAVVAVLDTGVTWHPDLAANLLPGYDFVSDVSVANDGNGRDTDPSDPGDWVSQQDKNGGGVFDSCEIADSSWHGTDIAGIIAAVTNNPEGVAGVNWNGRVLPVRVAGKCGADVADIVDGMRWAAGLPVSGVPDNTNPARIVNISFGGSAACNAAYQSAVDDLAAVGAVVVAAAGNERTGPTRPASCTGVIGVAALNRDGFKATYSNFGPALTVATVGGDPSHLGRWGSLLGDDGILTLDNAGFQSPGSPTYSRVSGSSFAAPIASGVVSLMLSANPSLTAAQIIQGLRVTARPHVTSSKIAQCSSSNPGRCICTTATCGAGILDAEQAVFYALSPTTYVAPVRTAQVIDSAEVDAAVALGQDVGTAPAAEEPSKGGGALGAGWLLMLAAAVAALARPARQR